ncbi:MAG: hypothetical protein R3F60_20915 [bacterium]
MRQPRWLGGAVWGLAIMAVACTPSPPVEIGPFFERGQVASTSFFLLDADETPRLIVVGAPPEHLRLTWQVEGGRPADLTFRAEARAGRWVIWPTLPAGALGRGRLTVRAEGEVVADWWLLREPASDPALAELVGLRQRGDDPGALAALRALLPRLDDVQRWRAWAEVARLAHARGDLAGALDRWQQAAVAAAAAGRLGDAARALRAASFMAYRAHAYAAQGALLDRAAMLDRVAGNQAGAVSTEYHRALMARRLGDLGAAERRFDHVIRAAWEAGADGLRAMALEARALLLLDVGRDAEAMSALLAAQAEAMGDVGRARALTNLGWALAWEAGGFEDPRGIWAAELLAEAGALVHARAEAPREANIEANLAWLAFKAGALPDALAHLEAARWLGAGDSNLAGAFVQLLEAEAKLARGADEEALAAFAVPLEAGRLDASAEAELAWRAAFGVARAAEALGDADAALAHLRRAYAAQNQVGRHTGILESRAPIHADRHPVVDALVLALLARGSWTPPSTSWMARGRGSCGRWRSRPAWGPWRGLPERAGRRSWRAGDAAARPA